MTKPHNRSKLGIALIILTEVVMLGILAVSFVYLVLTAVKSIWTFSPAEGGFVMILLAWLGVITPIGVLKEIDTRRKPQDESPEIREVSKLGWSVGEFKKDGRVVTVASPWKLLFKAFFAILILLAVLVIAMSSMTIAGYDLVDIMINLLMALIATSLILVNALVLVGFRGEEVRTHVVSEGFKYPEVRKELIDALDSLINRGGYLSYPWRHIRAYRAVENYEYYRQFGEPAL